MVFVLMIQLYNLSYGVISLKSLLTSLRLCNITKFFNHMLEHVSSQQFDTEQNFSSLIAFNALQKVEVITNNSLPNKVQ